MFTKRFVACAAALTAAVMTVPASAGYFGLGVGKNKVQDWDDVGASLDDGSFSSQESEDSDTGFRVFGGFGGTDTISFEIGYSDFGEATFDAESDGSGFYPAGPISLQASTTGIDFGIAGRIPLSDAVAVVGRIGMLMWEAEFDAQVSGGSGSESEDGNDIFFGGGLDFTFSPTVSLRGEFARYALDDNDIDSLSLSLIFRGGN